MPENITSVLIIYTGGTIGMVENSKTGKGFVLKSEKNPDLQKNPKPDSQGD